MKRNNNKKHIPSLLVEIIIGFIIGIFCSWLINVNGVDISFDYLSLTIPFIIFFFISFVLQIIIHEAGHLIFGLLTKYKFSSFRIFNIQFIKENGKLVTKKYSLVGTAGQCLLAPPDKDEKGDFPYILYNLGGVIINFVFTIIPFYLFMASTNTYVKLFMLSAMMAGSVCVLMNGIPMNTSEVPNDGYNVFSLSKDKNARDLFWTQLKILELQSSGTRIKDMPEEYFKLNDSMDKHNVLVSTLAVFNENRLMDKHNFDEARELIIKLLSDEYTIVGIYETFLILDKLYIDAISGKEVDKSVLKTNKNKNFLKSMKNNPSVLRTNYTLSLLVDHDSLKAAEYKNSFQKITETHPIKADIESESELISIAEERQ